MDDQQDALLQPDQKEGVEKEQTKDPSDNLTPEHPRFKEVIEKLHRKDDEVESLKAELEELKQSVSTRQTEDGTDTLLPDERAAMEKIREQLRRSGEFVTKEELDNERRTTQMASEMARLSKEFDGTNGYPKFDRQEVLAYAKSKGFGNNLEDAYYSLHRPAIIQVEAKKIGRVDVPDSERPTASDKKSPGALEVTSQDIANMSDAEYERNRAKILSSIKGK